MHNTANQVRPPRLLPLAPNLWHAIHRFSIVGMPASSRMTVVRLGDGTLWLHSPIPIDAQLKIELNELGDVAHIVAPNCSHHLFAGDALRSFPAAQLWGAPGLHRKRPDLLPMQTLPVQGVSAWAEDLQSVFVDGMPLMNETVWFHPSSGTLIVTDLCQWFSQSWPWSTRFYGLLMGVNRRVSVSRLVRWVTKDREAAARSAELILAWPFTRVILAHDCILDKDAHNQMRRALAWFELQV